MCPLVSVIMPLFNSEQTVFDSVKSIQIQTISNFELIIIDDKSTDKSLEVVNSIASSDSRIKVISLPENVGAGAARSEGIKRSSGRYIAFLDSDDIWVANKLSVQLQVMKKENAVFSCSWYDVIDPNGELLFVKKPPSKINYRMLLKENKIGCLTVIFDTDYFGRREMSVIRKRQDYALWLSFLKETEYCVCVQESLGAYKIRPESISSNKIEMLAYNYRLFREIEGFNALVAFYYVSCNVFSKLLQSLKYK